MNTKLTECEQNIILISCVSKSKEHRPNCKSNDTSKIKLNIQPPIVSINYF